ncbi:NAD(P)/FAD-dependent oxidoreductase [Flavobacterium sp. MAH-1]|uniref:NAD(P)/FAD-dependent oxidoreductase n=1 Tax=Flavobacterium agri TaxID=2743471 RepID=A0A7Y8Y616_9FLAO|nr:NAD(P)/FAD-dependent oxidoreductase [Flavobacterium agri]NUY81921.1 NAD(P)/FAD-dependent oxidoreductase [Flavobacterium agri]NYA71945.1 NAD(P)/FAD-dependent oxidoreductase [Flavobacterium agri]
MEYTEEYDAIVVGGSYSGLAAAMALARALKKVLVIDSGKPCNAQTPFSHNFLTQDGVTPADIASKARNQVLEYTNVVFFPALATDVMKTDGGFLVYADKKIFKAGQLIFATGIRDMFPDIEGFSECWGISVLHCPYCHGFEVKNQKTAIFGDGDTAFDFTRLIFNWTKDITLYTNGFSKLTAIQRQQLLQHGIPVVEKEIARLEHNEGRVSAIHFKDSSSTSVEVIYSPRPFEQHSKLPEKLGCALTDEGYLKVDAFQETSIQGIFASGDSTSRMRTVANAVASGTVAGISASKKMILEAFKDNNN